MKSAAEFPRLVERGLKCHIVDAVGKARVVAPPQGERGLKFLDAVTYALAIDVALRKGSVD